MDTSIIITSIICLTIIILVLIFQLTPSKDTTNYSVKIDLKQIPELKDRIKWDNCELKIDPKLHIMKLSYSDNDSGMDY